MNSNAEHDIFVHISTTASFNDNLQSRRNSHTSTDTAGRQRGRVEGGDGPPTRPAGESRGIPPTCDTVNFQSVSWALDVLKEGKMDVGGFLDALCWGNQLAVMDPTVRHTRTSLMDSDRLVTVVSR